MPTNTPEGKEEYVEVIQHYINGVLTRLTYNGIEQKLPNLITIKPPAEKEPRPDGFQVANKTLKSGYIGEFKEPAENWEKWEEEYAKKFVNLMTIVIPVKQQGKEDSNHKLVERTEEVKDFIRTLLARSLEEQRGRDLKEIDQLIGRIIQESNHPDGAWYDGLRCVRESIKKFYK